MQYSHDVTHDSQHKKMEHMQIIITNITNIRDGKTRPRLENTTPAVCSPGLIVELEPGGVSGCGKKIKNKVKQTKKGTHKVKVGKP